MTERCEYGNEQRKLSYECKGHSNVFMHASLSLFLPVSSRFEINNLYQPITEYLAHIRHSGMRYSRRFCRAEETINVHSGVISLHYKIAVWAARLYLRFLT